PDPPVPRLAQAHLCAGPDLELAGGVVAQHDGGRAIAPEQVLRHPPCAPVGAGAPAPARKVRVVAADLYTVTRPHGDRIAVLRRIAGRDARHQPSAAMPSAP